MNRNFTRELCELKDTMISCILEKAPITFKDGLVVDALTEDWSGELFARIELKSISEAGICRTFDDQEYDLSDIELSNLAYICDYEI